MISIKAVSNIYLENDLSFTEIKDNLSWLNDYFPKSKVCFINIIPITRSIVDFCNEISLSPILFINSNDDIDKIEKINVDSIKVSTSNDLEFYKRLFNIFSGNLYISIGSEKRSKINKIINLALYSFPKNKINLTVSGKSNIYNVNSTNLLEVRYYKDIYSLLVNSVGFYSEGYDDSIDSSAITLGSNYIEKKVSFNLEKNKDSLNLYELKSLLQKLKELKSLLKYK